MALEYPLEDPVEGGPAHGRAKEVEVDLIPGLTVRSEDGCEDVAHRQGPAGGQLVRRVAVTTEDGEELGQLLVELRASWSSSQIPDNGSDPLDERGGACFQAQTPTPREPISAITRRSCSFSALVMTVGADSIHWSISVVGRHAMAMAPYGKLTGILIPGSDAEGLLPMGANGDHHPEMVGNWRVSVAPQWELGAEPTQLFVRGSRRGKRLCSACASGSMPGPSR